MPAGFLTALAVVKQAAAEANRSLGLLDPVKADLIVAAAQEVVDGRHWDQFLVDIYQTGSATASNMNCNEVIAALCRTHLTPGLSVHPNDDVNKGQSSNDVVPTAMHAAVAVALTRELRPALRELHEVLTTKAREFWPVVKVARTHLQDATPIRLGQEFLGYAGQVSNCLRLVERALADVRPVPLGGTAVGTGINTHPEFAARACAELSRRLRVDLVETENHFQAQSTLDAVVTAHGGLKAIALSLWKVANDIRLLATGPRAGLGELVVPEAGVASSIMPGKTPPAVIESLTMVAARVVGNDGVLCFAQTGSILELNVMMPVAIAALLESVTLLAAASRNLAVRCVAGLRATETGPRNVHNSVMLATALSPRVGYDTAARISRDALATGESIHEVAPRYGFTAEQLRTLLDPRPMTGVDDDFPVYRAGSDDER